MPTTISGDPTTVSSGLAKVVSNATNASPIVITTTTTHGYATGDTVTVSGVLGNTAANGTFLITVLTTTTFRLIGSVGNGAYTSGGATEDLSLTPSFTIPADGDLRSAASVNVALRALADRTQYLNQRLIVLASTTTLKAIATPKHGWVRVVNGQGVWTFDSTATGTDNYFKLTPDDATPGRWVSSTTHQEARSILVPCHDIRAVSSNGIGGGASATTNVSDATAEVPWAPIAAADGNFYRGSLAPFTVYTGGSAGRIGWYLPLDKYLHDGATISTVALIYRPVTGHGGLPTTQPMIAINRVALTGYSPTIQTLLSTGGGFKVDTAASVVAYEADRQISFAADQNNVIDKGLYRYYAIIVDEGGTNALARNMYHAIAIDMFTIPNAAQP